jgi:TIGR03009 family protein
MLRRVPVPRHTMLWMTFILPAFAGLASGQERPAPAQAANQPERQSPAGQRQPRPDEVPSQAQTPPELIPILDNWERKSAAVQRVHAEFQRYEYDYVFMIEKRSVGEYWFESPDKGRIDFNPDENLPEPPQNQHPSGKVFTVQSDGHKVWVCTGKEILDIDVPNRTYNKVEIPEQYQGERITDGPLPFLFGMKADKVKERYLLQVGSMHDPNQRLHIIAYPLLPHLRREFQRAEVLLDPQSYTPTAVKLKDPSGNKETVYVFGEHKKVSAFSTLWGGKPWNVNLRGYKLMEEFKSPPEGTREGNQGGILIR